MLCIPIESQVLGQQISPSQSPTPTVSNLWWSEAFSNGKLAWVDVLLISDNGLPSLSMSMLSTSDVICTS